MKKILVLLCFCVFVFAESAKVQGQSAVGKPKGSISGRVFAITKGGDIKPARLAHVSLIGDLKRPPDTAVSVFLDAEHDGYERLNKLPYDSEESSCRQELHVRDESVASTIRWVEYNEKYSEFLTTQADEEGTFHISGIEPGGYTLVVRGRAGMNEAYWETDVFFIQVGGKMSWKVGGDDFIPGKDVSIKLSSPEKSCFAPNE
jgi:hypothetical protein